MSRMVKCTVVAPMGVTVNASAVVGLTAEQAGLRDHAVKPVAGRDGVYTLTGSTMFKLGEVVSFPEDAAPKGSPASWSVPVKKGKAEAAAEA